MLTSSSGMIRILGVLSAGVALRTGLGLSRI